VPLRIRTLACSASSGLKVGTLCTDDWVVSGRGGRGSSERLEHKVTLNIGIVLALACAMATQLGFLYKHRGANAAPKVDIRHPLRTVKSLFASKWFAIGMGVALGAWLLHVAALAFAPLSVVQAVLSTGVVMLAVLADRLFGFEVGRRQWLGVAMTAAGLILLVMTFPAHSGAHSSYSLAGMLAFEGGMLAIGALLITGPRMGAPDHHHGIMLGAAAGVLFGVSDIAIKALTGLGGPLEILLSPWLAFTILASIVAFYASARGLQDGEAVPVIASTSTAANVSCILGGIVVFGDPMPNDTFGIVIQALAFTLVIVAALVTPPPMRAAEANAQPA
jgi:drug/metabolite transporter (DMT)-like permease